MLAMQRSACLPAPAGASGHRGQAQQRWHLTGWEAGAAELRFPDCALREDCYLWRTRSWPVATSRRTTSAVSSADIADESITCFS